MKTLKQITVENLIKNGWSEAVAEQMYEDTIKPINIKWLQQKQKTLNYRASAHFLMDELLEELK